ncbi:MAG TPA: SRPBCC domain-containing protein [Steroidobacteraceae bacterium]
MSDATRGYAHRVDIHAQVEAVWQALIDPALLARWYSPGTGVRIDAREGGTYGARHGADLDREAHIDVFLPPRRLRLIYMPLPGLPDDGVVIVEDFLLDGDPLAAQAAGVPALTVLRLLGSGVPDGMDWGATYLALRRGWERSLLRLKVLLERPPERAGPSFNRLTGL